MTNKDVIRAFCYGRPARTANLSTDGRILYSYDLVIALWAPRGVRIGNYTASGDFHSVTTSKHVGMVARAYPDRVLPVDQFEAVVAAVG